MGPKCAFFLEVCEFCQNRHTVQYITRVGKAKKMYEIFMKSKASTGTAREGREKQGGPAAGRRLCFHLTHGPLRFMTFSTCRSLDERHERKGGRAA